MSEKWNCYYISVQAYNTVIYVTCRIILPHYKKSLLFNIAQTCILNFLPPFTIPLFYKIIFYFNKSTFKGKRESFLRSHKLCNILWIDSTLQIKHLRENKLFVEECRLPAVSPHCCYLRQNGTQKGLLLNRQFILLQKKWKL